MISHVNVIANVLQYITYESVGRAKSKVDTQVCLGLLPFSHIYALVVIVHGGVFRGDGVIVLPKFELPMLLQAIQRFKIEHMCLVSVPVPRSPSLVRILAENGWRWWIVVAKLVDG